MNWKKKRVFRLKWVTASKLENETYTHRWKERKRRDEFGLKRLIQR